MKFYKLLRVFFGLPKSLLLNLHYFGAIKAWRFPILVSPHTKIDKLGNKKAIKIDNLTTGCIRVGIGDGSFNLSKGKTDVWHIGDDAEFICHGKVAFSRGTVLNVNGKLEIGNGFTSNSNFLISVEKSITIGDNCLCGWDITIIDGDGHKIISGEEVVNNAKEVTICDNVWLCYNVSVLKGAYIGKDSVVASNSNVVGKFEQSGVIIGGNPAKIIKQNIRWEK